MPESFVHESRRSRIARRVGAAGMALATLLVLGACKADGGGYLGAPLDGGPVAVYDGDAYFGFNFTCHIDGRTDQPVIRGQITYRDSATSTVDGVSYQAIRLHGVVDPLFVEDASSCAEAVEGFPYFPDAALFQGTYRPQGPTPPGIPGNERHGRFTVQVFDQGEPGSSRGEITGDGFAIELFGGAYAAYTRGGYIEGGNVQVRGSK